MIAQDPLADLVPILLLIIALVLVMLMLYISVRLITGKKDADAGYLVRLLIVALIVVIVFPAVAGVINEIISTASLNLAGAGLASIVAILMFVVLIYVTKILLIPETASYDVWERSIWISLLAVFFILLLNAVGILVGVGPLVPFTF